MLTSLGRHMFKLSVTLGSPLCLIVLRQCQQSISLSVNLIKANVCVCVCLPRAAVPLLNLYSSGLSYHDKESAEWWLFGNSSECCTVWARAVHIRLKETSLSLSEMHLTASRIGCKTAMTAFQMQLFLVLSS